MTVAYTSTVQGNMNPGCLYRGYCYYDTEQTSTSKTITLSAKVQMMVGYYYGVGISITGSGASSVSKSATGYISTSSASYANVASIAQFSKKFTRTHSDQTFKVVFKAYGTTVSGVGSAGGSASLTRTFTIPALDSYKVTYNAAGGTGAPSAQTKWYGETLTISSTKPTKSGYTFQYWSGDNGYIYKPGSSYTGNHALVLTAVWKENYSAPTINSSKVYRYTDNTSIPTDEGTNAFIRATVISNDNHAATIYLYKKLSSSSSWGTEIATFSMTAAETTKTITHQDLGIGTNSTYNYRLKVVQNDYTTYLSLPNITPAAYIFDVYPGGESIGVFQAAESSSSWSYPRLSVNGYVYQTKEPPLSSLDSRVATCGYTRNALENLFEVTNEHITAATIGSVSANSGKNVQQTATLSGYYPIGVVGFYTGSYGLLWRGCYISNNAVGSGTINLYVRNVTSSAISGADAYVRVLWVKRNWGN